MKKKTRIIALSAVAVIVCLAVSLCFKGTWLFSISFYQKYISPHKGYHCAHASWHQDVSCSQYGKIVIAREGVVGGLRLLDGRFAECKMAAVKIDSAKSVCQSGRNCEHKCCGKYSSDQSRRPIDCNEACDNCDFFCNSDSTYCGKCNNKCGECGSWPVKQCDKACGGSGGGGWGGIIPPGTN